MLTEKQIEENSEIFLENLVHPMKDIILNTLQQQNVWVWGSWVGDRTKTNDVSGDVYYTEMLKRHTQQSEEEWLFEQTTTQFEENPIDITKPFTLSKDTKLDYESSPTFGVNEHTMKFISYILNSMDCFVMGDEVYIASIFEKELNFPFQYQHDVMWMWEEDNGINSVA